MEPDRAVKYITALMTESVRMSDLEKAFGTPIDTFQTFNDRETICCISGLTYPLSRLEIVYEKVDKNKELIKKNLAATQETGLKGGVNFLDEIEPAKKENTDKKPQSKRDIMNKYL